MSTHVAAPTATPTAVFPAAPGWLTLSAAFGDEVPTIADRDDLVVTVAPGAGHGAPACFFPDLATIEIDGSHVDRGIDPATVAPHRLGDRKRYRIAWGLLTHECAHAKHSVWRSPDDAPPGAAAAAELLEESRIEAAHIRRRPDDRYWLRSSATKLILADTQASNPVTGPKMTAQDAARSAALLLARVDGGILNRHETTRVAGVVKQILGDTLDALREIWREAHRTDDDATEAMIDLGRRWCEALGTDPDEPPPDPGDDGSDSGQNGNGIPSPLARAVASAATTVSLAVAADPAPTDPLTEKLNAAADEEKAQQNAQRNARAVFNGGAGQPPAQGTTTRGTRAPRASERTAARQLARALTTAGARDRTVTKTRSVIPPGRLRMRGAMTADAQRAAGAIPTAEPFTRTTRATVPAPPLRIGIACDVSGSMDAFAGPVASAAWILADAARHTAVPAITATVIFGYQVRPITHPGSAPPKVTEFDTNDGEHHIDTAIDALDGALNLSRPDAARLLVIISDGRFEDNTKIPGQKMLDRLRASGCAVLWLAPDVPGNEPMNGATVHTLTDPTTTARAIGQAATAALRATH